MRKKLIRALKSELVKTSALNGIANIVRILTGIISNKIVAVYLGPSGIALLGQFNNLTSIAMSFSTLGINSGITKYTAEYFDNHTARRNILSTGFAVTVIASVITSIVIYIARGHLSQSLLHSAAYSSVFGWLSLTLILFAVNAYLNSVLNGYKEFKKIISVNITTSIIGLIIAIVLVVKYGLYGAFIGAILSQTLVCFITIVFILKCKWFRLGNFLSGIHKENLVKLGKFSLMAFTSLFAITFIQLQIRNYIISSISIQDAGYWQGVTRVSDIYLTFITTTLAIYYLPRLSEIKKNDELKQEIKKGYMFLLPLTIVSTVIMYCFRSLIVDTLFAKSFSPMVMLFPMQLLGNIFKISSWLLGYVIIAKAMTRVFIITELVSGISFYILTRCFVARYGVVGATYSYAVNYLIYMIVLSVIFKQVFIKKGIYVEANNGFSSDTNL